MTTPTEQNILKECKKLREECFRKHKSKKWTRTPEQERDAMLMFAEGKLEGYQLAQKEERKRVCEEVGELKKHFKSQIQTDSYGDKVLEFKGVMKNMEELLAKINSEKIE